MRFLFTIPVVVLLMLAPENTGALTTTANGGQTSPLIQDDERKSDHPDREEKEREHKEKKGKDKKDKKEDDKDIREHKKDGDKADTEKKPLPDWWKEGFGRFRGTVKDGEGNIIKEGVVTVLDKSGKKVLLISKICDSGVFEAEWLEEGTYTIMIQVVGKRLMTEDGLKITKNETTPIDAKVRES